MNIELTNDNTQKIIPECPVIAYELVADMGEDGTKTIYDSNDLSTVLYIVEQLKNPLNEDILADFSEDERKKCVGLSIYITLTASKLEIVKYDGEMTAECELMSYEVK